MKRWIAAVAIGTVWLGSLYLAYGFGGLIGTYMPGPVSGPARAALSVMMLLPGSGRPCDVDDPMSCGFVAQFGALAASLPGLGIDAPVWPAVATRCDIRNGERMAESSERIRLAQQSLPERLPNVRPGPDTDAITGPLFRPDGCHFTHKGIDAHARLWVEALRET